MQPDPHDADESAGDVDAHESRGPTVVADQKTRLAVHRAFDDAAPRASAHAVHERSRRGSSSRDHPRPDRVRLGRLDHDGDLG
jgi:hypothetical protein